MKSDLIDITCTIRQETERAIMIDDGVNRVWLPLSQIEVEIRPEKNCSVVTLPEWLAKDKGLI